MKRPEIRFDRWNDKYDDESVEALEEYTKDLENKVEALEQALKTFKNNSPSSEEVDCFIIHKSAFEAKEQALNQ